MNYIRFTIVRNLIHVKQVILRLIYRIQLSPTTFILIFERKTICTYNHLDCSLVDDCSQFGASN